MRATHRPLQVSKYPGFSGLIREALRGDTDQAIEGHPTRGKFPNILGSPADWPLSCPGLSFPICKGKGVTWRRRPPLPYVFGSLLSLLLALHASGW